jgi:hypothetical protein
VAFLDGAAAGLGIGGHMAFSQFLNSLAEEFNHPKSFTPWEFLLNMYGHEDKVLEALPQLFREYADKVYFRRKD